MSRTRRERHKVDGKIRTVEKVVGKMEPWQKKIFRALWNGEDFEIRRDRITVFRPRRNVR